MESVGSAQPARLDPAVKAEELIWGRPGHDERRERTFVGPHGVVRRTERTVEDDSETVVVYW